jgi:hypothetical protein
MKFLVLLFLGSLFLAALFLFLTSRAQLSRDNKDTARMRLAGVDEVKISTSPAGLSKWHNERKVRSAGRLLIISTVGFLIGIVRIWSTGLY